MTEFIISCESELKPDGSYDVKRWKELVRCRDCTHRNNSLYCPIELLAETVMKTKAFDFKVSDDWFCADGERKTNDG